MMKNLLSFFSILAIAAVSHAQTTMSSRATGNWSNINTWISANLTGTISTTTGSATVTGTGTSFTTQLVVGAAIYRTNGTTLIGTVQSITNNTTLVLTGNAANNNTNASFTTRKVPGAADAVSIGDLNGTITVDVAAVAASITTTALNLAGSRTIAVSGTNSLTVSGDITLNGTTATTGTEPTILDLGTGSVSCNNLSLNITAANSGSTNRRTQLTLSTGTFTASGNISVSTAITGQTGVAFTGTGSVNVGGTFMSANAGYFSASTGTVNYNGTAAQLISNYAYNSLSVENGGVSAKKTLNAAVTSIPGNLTVASGAYLELAASTTVAGTLTLTNGRINTGVFTLTLTNATPASQLSGGSANAYVISTGAGRLRRNGLVTAINNFPVGSASYYLPVQVDPDVVSDFAVNSFDGITANGVEGGTAFGDKSGVVDAIWNVDRPTGSGDADLYVYWDAALEGSAFALYPDLAIGISRYSAWWTPATGDGSNTTNVAYRTLSTFSPFGVGRAGAVLPITFASIKAYEKQQGVQIDWSVLTDKTVSRYEVERSADGRTFKSIGAITSRGSQHSSDYNFYDASPISGTGFYRIRSMQLDGTASYSTILRVSLDKSNKEVVIYPNPVKGRVLSLQAADLGKGNYTFKLYNTNGKEMMKTSIKHDGGSINQTLNLPAGLTSGMYQVQLEHGGNRVMSKKIVVQQ